MIKCYGMGYEFAKDYLFTKQPNIKLSVIFDGYLQKYDEIVTKRLRRIASLEEKQLRRESGGSERKKLKHCKGYFKQNKTFDVSDDACSVRSIKFLGFTFHKTCH
ncbi:hypothetical protein RF11_00734 [Thelohanellus kitauei]|uniref:Uncharacterized protein n=1 Tax=Thelohanellus kitauei TaxID=669202 RepID=A0A0C2NEC1_THEKT|nr:hypothetical protein RF11_00734 [Thelohanellus kitauei]